jgi:hypothetical protein
VGRVIVREQPERAGHSSERKHGLPCVKGASTSVLAAPISIVHAG